MVLGADGCVVFKMIEWCADWPFCGTGAGLM